VKGEKMKSPILTLQYFSPNEERFICIASTKDRRAMSAFKQACLDEARLKILDWGDEVLLKQSRLEAGRLEELLSLLIPDEGVVNE